MGSTQERVALVVGGHRGIGGATAARLRREGARVVVLDLLADGEDADSVRVDLADAEAARAAVVEIGRRFGRLDVLVLAAGIKVPGTVVAGAREALTLTDWDRTFAVNVRPLFVCVEAALPYLRKGSSAAIVTVASASAHAEQGALAYSSSKGAVLSFTRSLALDLIPEGIRVNAVLPGFTATEMARDLPEAMLERKRRENVAGRLGSAEDVAAAICHLCSTDSLTVSGAVLDVGHVQGAFVDARSLSAPSSER